MGKCMWKSPIERIFINSFPRCGRHWIMTILVKYFRELYNIPDDKKNLMDLWKLKSDIPNLPFLVAEHDDLPCYKEPQHLSHEKLKYRNHNVILLIRDPRDTMVSNYFWTFQNNLPKENLNSELSNWVINNKKGGLRTLIEYYNIWVENKDVPKKFMILKYEDLSIDVDKEICRVLEFSNIKIDKKCLKKATKFGSFDNLRKLEKMSIYDNLKHREFEGQNSCVIRRGKVSGYVDYLTKEEINTINKIIKDNLDDFYSFYK